MRSLDDQLREIREIAYKGKDVSERLEANWDRDRKDFAEFISRVGHLEEEFKALRDLVTKMPQKTQDKVQEAVQPMIDTTDALTETIEKKRVIEVKSKPWWHKFLRR